MSKIHNTIQLKLDQLKDTKSAMAKAPDYYNAKKSENEFESGNLKLSKFEFGVKSDEFTIPVTAFIHQNENSFINPTIFWCHGGPHARNYPDELFTIAAKLKCHVVGFEYRGSTSNPVNIKVSEDIETPGDLGQFLSSKYYRSLDTDYGGGHMRDLKAVVSYISSNFNIDKNKFILAGHSFGGYKTALGMMDTELSEYFALGICASGFYEIVEHINYFCPGDPTNNPELQKKRSPLSFAKEVAKKIIIIHGGEDDKTGLVNLDNTKKFVENLSEAGKEMNFIQVTDGNHWDTSKLLSEILATGFELPVTEDGCNLLGLIT